MLPDHANFLTSLEIGPLSATAIRTACTRLAVRGGFAEVSDNVMTVLVEDAVSGREVDPACDPRSTCTQRKRAVANLSPIDPEYAAADAKRRWAQARLEVAGR